MKMKKEVPIKIIKGCGRHKTETRVFARDIHEHYCVQEGCKFRGKPAQQGVCHTTEPFVDGMSWDYLGKIEKYAENCLKDARRMHKGKTRKEYISYLESCYVCDWISTVLTTDELIMLRKKLALANLALAKKKHASK
jgi:hypothetical protein